MCLNYPSVTNNAHVCAPQYMQIPFKKLPRSVWSSPHQCCHFVWLHTINNAQRPQKNTTTRIIDPHQSRVTRYCMPAWLRKHLRGLKGSPYNSGMPLNFPIRFTFSHKQNFIVGKIHMLYIIWTLRETISAARWWYWLRKSRPSHFSILDP